ncbi:uncharacterized protein LOC119029534 isoform X1 [Acanthopagrus latus]|uniref:uncharacterized protein LOC119029534 isoform X1 n=1 Tax=Acanthopagrus latus TaxID=8177 RepID=UPI00187D0A13|nr:uncharacterized protein LOC119029534 isoform X1 [Acanthopagrus latus]
MLICLFIYTGTGVCGFLTLGSNVSQDVLMSSPPPMILQSASQELSLSCVSSPRTLFYTSVAGVVSYSQDQVTGSVLEVSVRPGDNITLYCDCKKSTGVYIVWYRNCSHENQPPFVLETRGPRIYDQKSFPRFKFVDNTASNSFDLLIMNVTQSDEGIYYCGTEQTKVEETAYIGSKSDYRYGNVTTRIKLNSSDTDHCQPPRPSTQDCGECWTLLFSLCPVSAVLSSLISALVAYHLCRKKAKGPQVDEQKPKSRRQTEPNQVEDVCYAALEIRQPSQRPKKKKRSQNSDFSTYSAIKTSRI